MTREEVEKDLDVAFIRIRELEKRVRELEAVNDELAAANVAAWTKAADVADLLREAVISRAELERKLQLQRDSQKGGPLPP